MNPDSSRRALRPKKSRDETRERILDAARSVFDEKGFEGLSMRRIAARAAMPTMTLYGYFPNKTAIIRGLWAVAFDPLFAEMKKAEVSATTPAASLRDLAHVYVDYWVRYPDRYRMVYMIEDRREIGEMEWFIDETDIVASHLRFGPLIAAARGTPDADCTTDAEALICALIGVVHMAITVSEYRWSSPESYVDRILPAFQR